MRGPAAASDLRFRAKLSAAHRGDRRTRPAARTPHAYWVPRRRRHSETACASGGPARIMVRTRERFSARACAARDGGLASRGLPGRTARVLCSPQGMEKTPVSGKNSRVLSARAGDWIGVCGASAKVRRETMGVSFFPWQLTAGGKKSAVIAPPGGRTDQLAPRAVGPPAAKRRRGVGATADGGVCMAGLLLAGGGKRYRLNQMYTNA
jgi:hypothetical protein